MKKIILIIITLYLVSCEDPIDINIDNGFPQLVVDAVLTNEAREQKVFLSLSSAYFNQEILPVSEATVKIIDSQGNEILLENNNTSTYTFVTDEEPFKPGINYTLEIEYNNQKYLATSSTRPVPPIDSITWTKESVFFGDVDSLIVAQFWGVDLMGIGDVYWVRSKLNGKYTDRTTIAFDAATGRGSVTDQVPFIAPVRLSITPNSTEFGERLEFGDELEVELYSVSSEFADFWLIMQNQLNNAGLFATPLTNVPSNIKNINPNGPKALGWFEVHNISRDSATITQDKTNNRAE